MTGPAHFPLVYLRHAGDPTGALPVIHVPTISEQDLGVLLGVRNCLDRFIELMEANAKATQAVELTLAVKYPPAYEHAVSLRRDLQGIIAKWRDPAGSTGTLSFNCAAEECGISIGLPKRSLGTEGLKEWLFARGWSVDDGRAFCFQHGPDPAQAAARRAEAIAKAAQDYREGRTPQEAAE